MKETILQKIDVQIELKSDEELEGLGTCANPSNAQISVTCSPHNLSDMCYW